MKRFYWFVLLVIASFTGCKNEQAPATIDLGGAWTFRQTGDSLWLPAHVPGTVQTDLYALNRIPDLFFADNELKNKWIENEDWIYRKEFFLDKNQLLKHSELVFEGLDTYATVKLNGHVVLQAENMFRTYRIEVDSFLRQGQNMLEVAFESPVQKAIPYFDSMPYRLPADNDRNQKQTSVFTRKAPYQYGWDWGPRYVTMGVWRPVYLQFNPDFKVQENSFTQLYLDSNSALLKWMAQIYSYQEQEVIWELNIRENDTHIRKAMQLKHGWNTLVDTLEIKNPERWWPNGYGAPKLYTFAMDLKSTKQTFSETKKLGLRTVELVTQPDSVGESFYFKINNVPIYAKGANYIPQDNFLPEVDSQRYAKLIESVAEANMNMLRVWGGGIYEDDLFYRLCDEKGIMVWQDFMFACSLYPADSAFLNNVKHEVSDNIRRIREHPSLVLWCGNNEINELWYNWGYQEKYGYSPADSLTIWNNYQKLFNKLIPSLVKKLNPSTPYWESSPKIGWGHPESLTQGDSHYWGVWWGMEPFEVYTQKVPRFASEFGFQSLPSVNTLLAFADSADLSLSSPAMRAHQKSSIGNQTLIECMQRDFPVPNDFTDFAYVSQLVQARGMQMAFEAQRKAKPRCMGTLYWQLNDCWPGISWSGLDYFGRWKALHYQAKQSFKTILISFTPKNDKLELQVVSDSLNPLKATLKLELIDFDGRLVFEKDTAITIPANASASYFTFDKKEILAFPEDRTFLRASLFSASKKLAEKVYYFVPPKQLQLSPDFALRQKREGNKLYLWSENKQLIKNVFLEADDVHFSVNYFDILPDDTLCVQLKSNKNLPDSFPFKSLNALITDKVK